MLNRALGWCAILLLLVGIVRYVPMSSDEPIAQATVPPAVVTIDPEASAAANVEQSLPEYEWAERIPSIEERIDVLESRSTAHDKAIESLVTRQSETVDLLGRVVAQHEALHKTVLGELKQSAPDPEPPRAATDLQTNQPAANPPAPPVAVKPVMPRKLLWFTAEWCGPCKAWGGGPERAKIAADGCEVVRIDIDRDLPPGALRPAQVPYFELHIGDKFARHTGLLTFTKFKEMESAVLNALQTPKPALASRKRWRIDEGHLTPSVEGMTIEHHLTEHHNCDIAGLTVDQMEAKHQAIHAADKVASNRSPVMPVQRFRDMERVGIFK